MIRKFLFSFYAITVFLIIFTGTALAVSVGKIEVASHLSEPFYGEVPLLLENDEVVSNVSVNIAGAEDYRVLEVYRDPVLKQIKTWLKTDKRGSRIEINSNSNIETPFFNLVLKVRYGHATHFKKYVVFLELPTKNTALRVADVSRVKHSTPTPTMMNAPSGASDPYTLIPAPAASNKKAVPVMNANSAAMKSTRLKANTPRAKGWSRTSTYGPIVRGDTITTVAQRLRIDDTFTNAQVMIALFEKNKAKFGEANINLIKAGVFLDIPSADEVRKYSPRDASRMLVSQNVQWKKLVQKPKYADIAKAQRNRYRPHVRLGKTAGGAAAKPIKVSKENKKTSVAKPVAEAKKSTASPVSNKLSAKEQSSSNADAAANTALMLENKNLKSKLAELEGKQKTVASAEQAALEARNKKLELQLVRLQAQLDSLKKESSHTPTSVTTEKPVAKEAKAAAVIAPAVVKPTVEKNMEKPEEKVQETAAKAETAKEAPVQEDVAVETDAGEEDTGEPSLVFGFPLMWVIGAVIILILLIVAIVFLVLRKRSGDGKAAAAATAVAAGTVATAAMTGNDQSSDGLDEFDASEMEAADLLAVADAAKDRKSSREEDDDFSSTIGGTRNKGDLPSEQVPPLTDEDTSEFDAFVEKDEAPSPDVDYLTEADVYLRYGMEDEAEEQVQLAMKLNEADPQAHVKMLQIRHAKGEKQGVDEAIGHARGALTGESLTSFEAEVTELGINASDVQGAIATAKTLEMDDKTEIKTAVEESNIALPDMESTAEVDMGQLKQDQGDLDFDLGDIDLSSVGTDAAMASAETSPDVSGDLDFDLGDIDLSSVGADQATAQESIAATDDLDFDLGEMDLTGTSDLNEIETSSTDKNTSTADDGLDFDFDMDDFSFDDDGDSTDASTNDANGLDLGDSEIDLGDDLAMLDMDFDDLPTEIDDASNDVSSDETIITDFSGSTETSGDSDFENLDFISTVTMEAEQQSPAIDLDGLDIAESLDSMSLMVDDITPALQSMETPSDDGDDELTKTLSTMSMLVDDMDTSEISIEMDDDDNDGLDLSLSTGDLDVSLQTRSALDDTDPDLTNLLGELEEITGLNDAPKR